MPARRHGRSKSYLYKAWTNLKQRCQNPNHPLWRYYGAKGVSVSPEWAASFDQFAADMGERPSSSHSIDRIDVHGNYEPGNCRWATRKVQDRNLRNIRTVTIEGTEYKAADLADLAGVKTDTIIRRVERGLDYDDVVGKKRLANLKGIRLAVKARSKKFREATHCQKGHEFTPENTYLTKEGWKRCRVCIREKEARYSDKKAQYKREWRAQRKAVGLPHT